MKTVLVVAGTSDASEIVRRLSMLDLMVIATVATDQGKEIISVSPNVKVMVGRVGIDGFKSIIADNEISLIVDASHPYAEEVTKVIIEASNQTGTGLIRYERSGTKVSYSNTIYVDSYGEAAKEAAKVQGNILLTTGSNNLEEFIKVVNPDRLFVRILPVSTVIRRCELLGLGIGNIIAVKGPFSADHNEAMINHIGAKAIITKDSGRIGGILEKIQAAESLGIKVIMIKKPKSLNEKVVSSIEDAVSWVNSNIFI